MRLRLLVLAAALTSASGMGECVAAVPAPAFCSMVAYNVTKDVHTPIEQPNNATLLDASAERVYAQALWGYGALLAGEGCHAALKALLCGALVPKCNPMNPLRPLVSCPSVCEAYAAKCGAPRELPCAAFGDADAADPEPDATPIAMCKGSSSFPRFLQREWEALMPGDDPRDAADDAEAEAGPKSEL